MLVTVYLNEQETPEGRHAAWDRMDGAAYQPGDKLRQAFQYETGDDGNPLNAAFFAFNVGDEPQYEAHRMHRHAVAYRAAGPNRSLSTGDVVAWEGQAYALQHDGWELVSAESFLANVGGRGPVDPDLEAFLATLQR